MRVPLKTAMASWAPSLNIIIIKMSVIYQLVSRLEIGFISFPLNGF